MLAVSERASAGGRGGADVSAAQRGAALAAAPARDNHRARLRHRVNLLRYTLHPSPHTKHLSPYTQQPEAQKPLKPETPKTEEPER